MYVHLYTQQKTFIANNFFYSAFSLFDIYIQSPLDKWKPGDKWNFRLVEPISPVPWISINKPLLFYSEKWNHFFGPFEVPLIERGLYHLSLIHI